MSGEPWSPVNEAGQRALDARQAPAPRPAMHPVQKPKAGIPSRLTTTITMRAYEVYSAVFGPQEALITGDCRGGMSPGELIAYLYAYAFPREQWRDRVMEAFKGMENL